MGTRHLICIFYNGHWVVAQYGQWDGYPDGQGVTIFKFLQASYNVDRLKVGINFTFKPTENEFSSFKDESNKWEAEQRMRGVMVEGESGWRHLYPSLSRDTSAKILEIIANATHDKRIPIYQSLTFANDGLFCEWAYVVDLDKGAFEIYGGFEKKHDGHRFKDVGAEDETVPAFVTSFDFSQLHSMTGPEEFLKAIPKISNSEEEA